MKKIILSIIFILPLLVLSGCRTAPSHFYVLSAFPSLHGKGITRTKLYLGLGPVSIPAYLDTPQIITRLSLNQLHLNEYHRWTSPLRDNVKRVLHQNFQRLLPHAIFSQYPWPLHTKIQYAIQIKILRFDTNSQGKSILIAQWKILDKSEKHIYYNQTTTLTHPAIITNYRSIVAAMSQNLSRLTLIIARRIRKIRYQK